MHVNEFLLFSLCVACFSLAAHTELAPYKYKELNSLATISHWQNLLCLVTMMIRDAQMYSGTEYELIGGELSVTHIVEYLTHSIHRESTRLNNYRHFPHLLHIKLTNI